MSETTKITGLFKNCKSRLEGSSYPSMKDMKSVITDFINNDQNTIGRDKLENILNILNIDFMSDFEEEEGAEESTTRIAWLYFDEEQRRWFLDNEIAYKQGLRAIAFVLPEGLTQEQLDEGFSSKSNKSWYPVYQGKALLRHRDSRHY